MKTLKLTLKKEWFDLINSGEKTEEYREIKEYWINRLVEEYSRHHIFSKMVCFKEYDFVEFKNGYSKNAPTIICELKEIEISKGNAKWGAIHNETYFVIKLGSITERYNC